MACPDVHEGIVTLFVSDIIGATSAEMIAIECSPDLLFLSTTQKHIPLEPYVHGYETTTPPSHKAIRPNELLHLRPQRSHVCRVDSEWPCLFLSLPDDLTAHHRLPDQLLVTLVGQLQCRPRTRPYIDLQEDDIG